MIRSLRALVPLLALVAPGLGCAKLDELSGKKSDEKATSYELRFVNDKTFGDLRVSGARLLVDGEELGVIDSNHVPTVRFELPAKTVLSDHETKLALRFPTPCGTKDIELEGHALSTLAETKTHPLTVEEERKARSNRRFASAYELYITVPEGLTLPEPFVVWVDDDSSPSAKIQLGAAEVDDKVTLQKRDERGHAQQRGRRESLYDLACAPSHDVRIDGVTVGTARADAKGKTAFLVTTEPGICHLAEEIVYSTTDAYGSGRRLYLEGSQVLPVGYRRIDYFLEPAPASIKGGGRNLDGRVALNRTTCKAPEPGKGSAAKPKKGAR